MKTLKELIKEHSSIEEPDTEDMQRLISDLMDIVYIMPPKKFNKQLNKLSNMDRGFILMMLRHIATKGAFPVKHSIEDKNKDTIEGLLKTPLKGKYDIDSSI